jgi:hypothetical protein
VDVREMSEPEHTLPYDMKFRVTTLREAA